MRGLKAVALAVGLFLVVIAFSFWIGTGLIGHGATDAETGSFMDAALIFAVAFAVLTALAWYWTDRPRS